MDDPINLGDLVKGCFTPCQTLTESSSLPSMLPKPFTTSSLLDPCVQRAMAGHSGGIPCGCILQLCGASGCGKSTVVLAAAVHVLADGIVSGALDAHHVVWISSSLTAHPFPPNLLLAALEERLGELGHANPDAVTATDVDPMLTTVIGVHTPSRLLGVLGEVSKLASDPSSRLGGATRVLVVLDCAAAVLQAAASELIPHHQGAEPGPSMHRKTAYPFVIAEIKREARNLLHVLLRGACRGSGCGGACMIITNTCTAAGGGGNHHAPAAPPQPFGGPMWRSVADSTVVMTMSDERAFLDTLDVEQTFIAI